jgi:hypothetical protein
MIKGVTTCEFVKTLALIALWCPLLNLAAPSRADTLLDSIKTSQGEIKSLEVNGRGQLLLNDKVIYKSTTERGVLIEKYFEKPKVLLINDGLRGSECRGKYRFITLKDDGSVAISKEIGNCTGPQVTEQNDQIIVKFPAWHLPGETWTFLNGQLTKTGQEYAVTPGIWQTSVEKNQNFIDLGIRDKHGDAHQGINYTAWFIVTAPDGRIYKAQKRVTRDKFGDVRFPRDFRPKITSLKAGNYHWKCVVEGGEVAKGYFQYTGAALGGFKAPPTPGP